MPLSNLYSAPRGGFTEAPKFCDPSTAWSWRAGAGTWRQAVARDSVFSVAWFLPRASFQKESSEPVRLPSDCILEPSRMGIQCNLFFNEPPKCCEGHPALHAGDIGWSCWAFRPLPAFADGDGKGRKGRLSVIIPAPRPMSAAFKVTLQSTAPQRWFY